MSEFKVGVVGLGYVGLPVAIAFSSKFSTIGFDISKHRIETLQQGIDYTGELSKQELSQYPITFSNNPTDLTACNFIIVAVPTPISETNQPDLQPLINATNLVGQYMSKGTTVVYESTVYPGTTEEICVPILENTSGYNLGQGFYVGYSPERINPGDKEHTFKNIIKIVSGQDENTLSLIADVYSSVVDAGVYRASSIKVAEAAKVIENTQRDINIALMNELALIFNKLEIDTTEVLKAAGTKWNFIPFSPGLVGGHCIGVDPYYLTYKAESVGYHPEVILSGRRINDNMGKYIATSLVKQLIKNNKDIRGSYVSILGMTFKENVPDIRNSKVIDIINELVEYGVQVQVADPLANPDEVKNEYGLELLPLEELKPAKAVVIAVSHHQFIKLGWEKIQSLLTDQSGIVMDIKSVLDIATCPKDIVLWRL